LVLESERGAHREGSTGHDRRAGARHECP
jgi:hypothetical protein